MCIEENINCYLLIALFHDEERQKKDFFAGIIAEPPNVRNQMRYLAFFDDGYAQYCKTVDLHRVCEQSKSKIFMLLFTCFPNCIIGLKIILSLILIDMKLGNPFVTTRTIFAIEDEDIL